jgi:leucyl/phenylalanyl-tRNA---protein transferase
MIPWLETDTPFPAVTKALTEADGAAGLLAAGADLSPERLLNAYRHGIFPWFSEGQPILWWSPDPRMVLLPPHFHPSASLRKTLKKIDKSMRGDRHWDVRFDTAFKTVMQACAMPRHDSSGETGGTWISQQIIDGYCALHQRGYAHSCELWRDGELVSGAYGVSIGRMFYGESMFTRVTDGSKVALAYLVHFLQQNGVAMIDCQQQTAHLASLGAAPISRSEFMVHLSTAIMQAPIPVWQPIALF